MLLAVDRAAGEPPGAPVDLLDVVEACLGERVAQVVRVEAAVVLAVLHEHVVQRLDLGRKRVLRTLAAAADLVQHVPARRHVGLDVLAHVGHDDAQDTARLQAAPALGEEARPLHRRLEMLEVVLDVDAPRRAVGERQAPARIDAHGDARRREEIEIDPAVLAERAAADIHQHVAPLLKARRWAMRLGRMRFSIRTASHWTRP